MSLPNDESNFLIISFVNDPRKPLAGFINFADRYFNFKDSLQTLTFSPFFTSAVRTLNNFIKKILAFPRIIAKIKISV